MILVPSTEGWNYWLLLDISLLSIFQMTRVNTDFQVGHSRIHLFVRWGRLLYITGWTAISLQDSTFAATRFRGMCAGNVLPERLVLIRQAHAEEFWPAAAGLRFIEGIQGRQYSGMPVHDEKTENLDWRQLRPLSAPGASKALPSPCLLLSTQPGLPCLAGDVALFDAMHFRLYRPLFRWPEEFCVRFYTVNIRFFIFYCFLLLIQYNEIEFRKRFKWRTCL